jgi:hypothetical protein
MRKSFFLLAIGILLCALPFRDISAEEESEPRNVGWGIAFGATVFPQPTLNYQATSIGDIKFPCQTYGGSFSVFAFPKATIFKRKYLAQFEAGISWLVENGHKNLFLQGYPATAESDVQQIGIGISYRFCYLRRGVIWISSGFEVYGGLTRDRFNIFLLRDNRKIDVFNPKTRTEFGAHGGIVLLSIAIIDNNWNSWDLKFGLGGVDATDRHDAYGRYSLKEEVARTRVGGWYFKISKLILFDFHKDRLMQEKSEGES